VCTVSGAMVTIVAGGTCTIQTQQAGNGNYNAATNVNQSFVVTMGAIVQYTYDAAGNVIKIERVGSPN